MAKKTARKQTNRVLGYLRVSTLQQDLESQKLAILEYARRNELHVDEFIEITISSRRTLKQRRIDELLNILDVGDSLIVAELSRLGRSVGQIISLVDQLIKNKVRLIAIKESIDVNGKKDMQTKIMITLFGLFAEIERDLISIRTREALAARKAKGVKLGRPKGKPGKSKLDEHKDEIIRLIKSGVPKTKVAKKFNTSQPNLYNFLHKNKINIKPDV